MDERIVEFVRGLRAGGATVSTAEALDALRAVRALGVGHKETFRALLRTTLIKHRGDFSLFDELFPLYFSHNQLALQNALEELSPADQSRLQEALGEFDARLSQLLDWLLSGRGPSADELAELMEWSGGNWAADGASAVWVTRRMLQQLGFGQLTEKLEQLAQTLSRLGMAAEEIGRLLGIVEANRAELGEYVARQVRLEIARRAAERPQELNGPDLLHKSFHSLTSREMADLRVEVERLVRQLKTRAALRRKRGARGRFDARGTIRHSQRFGGVPLEIRHKKPKLKPEIVLIFDVSRSMQTVVEFLLYFVLAVQDQVSRLRSFAFYDNLGEVTDIVKRADRHDLGGVFERIQKGIPGTLWRTNLGFSLQTFVDHHLTAVSGRSTVIIIGDGRNNYENPRLDLVELLRHRAKRVVWLTPENRQLWGTGDSDMDRYAQVVDEVFLVRSLAQLAAAVDGILL